MADALRRAGLLGGKDGDSGGGQTRRSDRP
jgi:hypothetical protein